MEGSIPVTTLERTTRDVRAGDFATQAHRNDAEIGFVSPPLTSQEGESGLECLKSRCYDIL